LLVGAAFMILPLGCVANQGDSSIRFLNARALTLESDECTASAEKFVTGGSLDLAGGSNYLLAPSVETNTATPATGTGQGLDVTLTELVYSYEVSPTGLKLPAEDVDRVPIYAVYRAGTDADQSFLFMHAFGPKALKSLYEQVGTSTEPVTVLATIYGRGYLSSGQSVESNKFTFPVVVYKSSDSAPPACADGFVPAGTCRIPGQDSNVGCVKEG
jgi:hypothetical protein